MAAFEKYTDNAVLYELRHNTRENPRPPKNVDIDPERTKDNYFLSPSGHGYTARASKDYYNDRLKDVYHLKRADVKTACQWIITMPKDLAKEGEKDFFAEAYRFLNSLYGEENCIQCVVHKDEGVKNADGEIIAGSPHMHYMFIPAVQNKGYLKPNKKGNITTSATFKEKVCADQLINKKHLQDFHPRFQKWLDDNGIKCTVHSGITGGKNRSVEELKSSTKELEREKDKVRSLEAENDILKRKILSLENELSKKQEKNVSRSPWGTASAWTRERSNAWEIEKEF